MTTYTLPATQAFKPVSMTMGLRANRATNTSPLNGATQTITLLGARWTATLMYGEQSRAERGALKGLLAKLVSGEDLLALPDLARPRPLGTCNTTGVTASAAAQFARSLVLNGCGASKTLQADDKISLGGQLLVVTDDAVANGSGVMTVSVRPELRAAVAGGAAVTLVAPTALFEIPAGAWVSQADPYDRCAPITIDLVERFA